MRMTWSPTLKRDIGNQRLSICELTPASDCDRCFYAVASCEQSNHMSSLRRKKSILCSKMDGNNIATNLSQEALLSDPIKKGKAAHVPTALLYDAAEGTKNLSDDH